MARPHAAPPPTLSPDPLTSTLRLLALVVALAYPIMLVAVAVLRMGYPFELEWMEGGVLGHVRRVMAGLPLYTKPSLDWTPFIYPPVFFWIAAGVAKVMGLSFTTLRLVSFAASLGCLALVYRIVAREGAGRGPAVLAACLFAAGYREGGAWFDVGRVDMVSLLFLLAAVDVVKRGASWRSAAAAGALFALAGLTKQSALFVVPLLAVALALASWRRGLAFAVALVAITAGVTLALDRASGGWYTFYVFRLPQHHPIIGQLLRGFWTQDLLGPFGIALTLGALRFFVDADPERAADRWFDLALAVGLILTAYATKIRVGSFDNLCIPAYTAASLLLGQALAALARAGAEWDAAVRARLERWVLVACVLQFAVLAYKPWQQLPTAADRQAGEQTVESLRRVPGDAWVPSHGYLAEMAGKPAHAHDLALVDALRSGDTPEHHAIVDELKDALARHRFGVIVLDQPNWASPFIEQYYDQTSVMFGDDEKDLFYVRTGYWCRPYFVWTPRAEATP